jgi:hypothetical protein
MLDMRDHLLLPLPRSGLFPRPIAQSPNGSVWLTWFGSYEEGIGVEFFEILLEGPEPRVLAPILAKDNEAAISQANELLRSWFESGLVLDQLPAAQPLLCVLTSGAAPEPGQSCARGAEALAATAYAAAPGRGALAERA